MQRITLVAQAVDKNDYIEKLEVLTPNLEEFVERRNGAVIDYKTIQGTTIGIGLFKDPMVAVQRVFVSKGTIFPEHTHEQWELAICYMGSMDFITDKGVFPVKKGEFVEFPPGTPHSVKVHEDSWLICLTIPAEPNYPSPGLNKQGEFRRAGDK